MTFEAPAEQEAAERAWAVVREAYETRELVRWPRRHARPLVAGALVAAVIAAVLSPPGRSVVHSLRDGCGDREGRACAVLRALPGSAAGEKQEWPLACPRGRLEAQPRPLRRRRVLAARPLHRRDASEPARRARPEGRRALDARPPGPTLPGLDRDADGYAHRLPLERPPSRRGRRRDRRPRTGASSGSRAGLAARAPSRAGLRAQAQARSRSWTPTPGPCCGGSAAREPVRKLQWSGDGRLLLVFAPHATRVYDLRGRVVAADDPSDATFDVDATFVPPAHAVVAIRAEGLGSSVFSIVSGRTLFRGTGTFSQLTFSPNGRWLLVSWPTANQWVFVRTGRHRKIVGASRISVQFGGFPRVEGWCCAP